MSESDNTEFPVPLARFLPRLVGTSDEVWTKLLKSAHGKEKHTPSEWIKILETMKAGG